MQATLAHGTISQEYAKQDNRMTAYRIDSNVARYLTECGAWRSRRASTAINCSVTIILISMPSEHAGIYLQFRRNDRATNFDRLSVNCVHKRSAGVPQGASNSIPVLNENNAVQHSYTPVYACHLRYNDTWIRWLRYVAELWAVTLRRKKCWVNPVASLRAFERHGTEVEVFV